MAVLAPTAAEAGDRHRSGVSVTISNHHHFRHQHHDRWRRSHHHHHRHDVRRSPRVVYIAPPPQVVYAPPPQVVYVPLPTVIYTDPPPVIAPAPIYVPPVTMQRVPGGSVAMAQPYCREFNTTTIVNGQRVNSYGTACQQPDGSWQVID